MSTKGHSDLVSFVTLEVQAIQERKIRALEDNIKVVKKKIAKQYGTALPPRYVMGIRKAKLKALSVELSSLLQVLEELGMNKEREKFD